MELRDHPTGGFRFLATTPDAPYSAGVVALSGYEVVHAVLRRHVPIAAGFEVIERHLRGLDRPRTALCAVELRGAAPYTPEDWTSPQGFNARYRAILREWGLFVDGFPAVARTNVVPIVQPPHEQVLHAFSYSIPLTGGHAAGATTSAGPVAGPAEGEPTFVTSGAPEAQSMWASPAGVDERLLSSLDAIGRAVAGLGRSWDDATTVDVYVREGITAELAQAALARLGRAAQQGLRWYLTKTPLLGPYLECDARGVRHEVQIDS